MKNLFKFATILMVATAIMSCKKDPIDTGKEPVTPGPDQPNVEVEIEYTEDIEFAIKVISVDATTAEIKVEHTGTEDDTWYGFVTTSTNVGRAMADMVAELTDNDDEKVTGLFNGYSKTIKLEGLEPETKYNYIVFAITEDGDVYGTEEHESFKTTTNYRVNSAWTVEFTERQFIGEEEYENTVTVTSKDENPYFMTVVTKDRFESTEIKTLLTEELESLKEFIDQYDKYYDVETTFKSWCFSGNAIDAFGLESDYDYIAMAIGASEDGELTGLYAYSDEFQAYEEEMTEAYASWIGNWTLTGANGVAFNVNIQKGKSNSTYIMTGWEGNSQSLSGVRPYLDVEIDWNRSSNTWMLWSQKLGTFISGGEEFTMYFTAGNYVTNGEELYMTDGLIICIGCDQPNGQRMIISYSEKEKPLYSHMRYAGSFETYTGTVTGAFTIDIPTFPITVTPAAGPKSADSTTKLVRRLTSTAQITVPDIPLAIKMIR